MLCSISQAGFASEHWNALKTTFQHGLPTWSTPSARADGRGLHLHSCHSLEGSPENFAEGRQAKSNACLQWTSCRFSRHSLPHLLLLKLASHLWHPEVPKHFWGQGTLIPKKLRSLGTFQSPNSLWSRNYCPISQMETVVWKGHLQTSNRQVQDLNPKQPDSMT